MKERALRTDELTAQSTLSKKASRQAKGVGETCHCVPLPSTHVVQYLLAVAGPPSTTSVALLRDLLSSDCSACELLLHARNIQALTTCARS